MQDRPRDKKLIFLSCIGLIILAGLLLLLFALIGGFNRSINQPVSYPDNTPDNVIDIGSANKSSFNFAVITNQDTIELRNRMGEIIIINLEKRNWKDLKWSPDDKHLAVLGESEDGVFEVYSFDVESRAWDQLTEYERVNSGVTSYAWIDNKNIYLKQGPENDNWVHHLNIESQANGIIKIAKLDGEIIKTSPDGNITALKDGDNFIFINLMGEIINTLNSLEVDGADGVVITEKIADLYFVDNEKIVYVTETQRNVLGSVETNEAVRFENINMQIQCVNEGIAFGFKQNGQDLVFVEGEVNSDEVTEFELGIQNNFSFNQRNNICYTPSNLLIGIVIGSDEQWYTKDGNAIVSANFMNNVAEIDAINN